jgi:hypothetical protein
MFAVPVRPVTRRGDGRYAHALQSRHDPPAEKAGASENHRAAIGHRLLLLGNGAHGAALQRHGPRLIFTAAG